MDEGTTPKYFYWLGGRKMALTVLAIAVGSAVDLLTDRGLSATFATFLAGAVASFSAANVINTVKMGSSSEAAAAPAEPDPRVAELTASLQETNRDLAMAKAETQENFQQAATAVQSLANTIENMRKVVTAIATGKKVS